MKKSNPDRERIPTLHDLVFPGNQELRRLQEHERERVEPSLDRDGGQDAGSHREVPVEDEYTDRPFVLLPDELDETLYPPPAVDEDRRPPDAALPEPEGEYAPSEPPEHPGTEPTQNKAAAPDHGNEAIQKTPGTVRQDSPLSDLGVAEEEVSIEDLMTYFYRRSPAPPVEPTATTGLRLADSPGHPLPPRLDPPSPADLQEEAALETEIHAAVRGIIESELEQLTGRITAAVLARLRR